MHDVAITRENPKCFTEFEKKFHPCNNIYIKHDDAVKSPAIVNYITRFHK